MEHPDTHKDNGLCKQEQPVSVWPLGSSSTATTKMKKNCSMWVQHMPKGPPGEIVGYSITIL